MGLEAGFPSNRSVFAIGPHDGADLPTARTLAIPWPVCATVRLDMAPLAATATRTTILLTVGFSPVLIGP
jgi:hypothetical protein